MKKIIVLLTCYNRKDKTLNCLNTLIDGNPQLSFSFIICDDNSNDGTAEMLKQFECVKIISGSGNLYYTGGMRAAINEVLTSDYVFDYVLFVNDDVSFFPNSIEKLVLQKESDSLHSIIVGCTCDTDGELSYGGVVYPQKSLKYKKCGPGNSTECDTFHANCVLMEKEAFFAAGNMDSIYHHSLGDFDYGLKLRNLGYRITVSNEYVGVCVIDSVTGTWSDVTLSRLQRIKKKEDYKGVPSREWFHYVHKNFGLFNAILHTITPYIKIILKK